MATEPEYSGGRGDQDAPAHDEVEREANDRMQECRRQKAEWEIDLREGYFFAAPHRQRVLSSRTPNTTTRLKDAGEASTSFAIEMAGDFATVVLNAFLPEAEQWCEWRAGTKIPDGKKKQFDDQLAQDNTAIFAAITESDFYSEFGKGAKPDLALGTMAMWIDDPFPHRPVSCQAVPIHELEISVGSHGEIDSKFHVRHTRWRYLRHLIPDVTLPQDLENKRTGRPTDRVELRRGFWKEYDDGGDPKYCYVVMIGNRLVDHKIIKGDGCCPLIVTRFGALPEWAYGAGPLIEALPDLRNLDELSAAKIENLDLALRPPVTLPDTSFVNFEEGIEAGMAYPIRPGEQDAIKHIYEAPSPQVAIYDKQDLEQRIKRLFFVDYPTQRGDTPPSATQWIDEMNLAQRRIGLPGLTFWREGPGEYVKRFRHILEKRGVLKKVVVDGRTVSLRPFNPAQRAAEQQEVAMAARAIQLFAPAFPEEWKAAVDGTATIRNGIQKLGADKIVIMRPPDQIKAAVDNIKQLIGGAAPGAGGAPAQVGQPEAPPPAGPQPAPIAAEQRFSGGPGK